MARHKLDGLISELLKRAAQIRQLVQTADDLSPEDEMEAGAILRCIDQVVNLHLHEVQGRPVSANQWPELASAVALSAVVLSRMRETDAEALAGWKFEHPENPEQQAYSFMWLLRAELKQGCAEIEKANPAMQHFYADFHSDIEQQYKV